MIIWLLIVMKSSSRDNHINLFVSSHSSVSLEGGCPSSAEVFETLKTCSIFKGLYSLFSVVDRFPYLRDFLNHFGLIDYY